MKLNKNDCLGYLPYIFSFYLLLCISSFSYCTAQNGKVIKRASTKKTDKRIFYGQASFYSNKFNSRRTASGEIFSQKKMTCACNVLPIGSWIKVTNLRNGKFAFVKVNDRMHPKMKRVVDLTRAGAQKLGFVSAGVTRVRVDFIGKTKPV